MGPQVLSIRLSQGALTGEGASHICAMNDAVGKQAGAADQSIAVVRPSGGRDTTWRRS